MGGSLPFVGVVIVALGPVDNLAVVDCACGPSCVGAGHAVVVAALVAVAVVGDGHVLRVFLHEGVAVSSGVVEDFAVVPHSGHACHRGPEPAAFRGKADVLGGVPADALHAEALEVLDEGFGAGLDFGVLGVYVAVPAELAVSDGVAVAVVDAALPAHTAVGVPPRVVVARGLVYVVGHDVDDDLDAVGLGLGAEALELLAGAVAVGAELEVVGHVGVEPFGVSGAVALYRGHLNGSESGCGDVGELGLDVVECPVEAMEDVAVLNC